MGYGISAYSSAPQQAIGTSRFESVIKAELALVSWRHGRNYGGTAAMTMIAQCLANRNRKGWGPFLQIIDHIPKFSATLEQPTGYPDAWNREFLKLLSDIDGIVDGTAKDTSNGALFFADTTNITNPWFLENIARSPEHHMVSNMNSLTFWD